MRVRVIVVPTSAVNVVAAKNESIKKKIADSKDQPAREWRVTGQPGLVLITRPSGAGTFVLIYRPQTGGKQRKLRLGDFPTVSLADASRMALEARLKIEQGGDPAIERARQRDATTFQALAEKFLTEGSLSPTTRDNYRWLLAKDAFPVIGSKSSILITADDVHEVCRRIKARGSVVQAQNAKVVIGGVYRWAIRERLAKFNPARDVASQVKPSRRTRSPKPAELKRLWLGLDKPGGLSSALKIIVKLAILTGQRRTEVCGARVAELHGLDTATPTWIIAADVARAGKIMAEGRMKNGTEQQVYLSKQAAALFAEAVKNCSDGEHLFPADTSRKTKGGTATRLPHIHGESVTKAVKRLCDDEGIPDLSIHDMRRAIANFLKDSGYGREVRDLILNHKDGSVDGQHCSNSARMEVQCRKAWQLWADHVDSVVGLSPSVDCLPVAVAVDPGSLPV